MCIQADNSVDCGIQPFKLHELFDQERNYVRGTLQARKRSPQTRFLIFFYHLPGAMFLLFFVCMIK